MVVPAGKAMRKYVLGGLSVVIALPIVAIASLEAWDVWRRYRFETDSPLAAGAYVSSYAISSENFRRRIRDAFPVGTPEPVVIDELLRQGFAKGFGHLHAGPAMILDRPGVVCTEFWEVFWTANALLKIQSIDGDLSTQCL